MVIYRLFKGALNTILTLGLKLGNKERRNMDTALPSVWALFGLKYNQYLRFSSQQNARYAYTVMFERIMKLCIHNFSIECHV